MSRLLAKSGKGSIVCGLRRNWSGPLGIATLAALSGCSWDRFDELRESPPVEALSVPTTVPSGFGSVLAAIADGNGTTAFVGGPPGASGGAVYLLGQDEALESSAVDSAHCQRGNASRTCTLARQVAGFRRAPGGTDRESCYVAGPGQKDGEAGLFARCETGAEFVFPVPADIESDVIAPLVAGGLSPLMTLSASRESQPVLVASVEDLGRAFYYEQDSTDPVDLAAAPSPASFGRTSAVLRVGGGWLLAVGAPDAGEVRLFRTDGSGADSVGCLSGASAFGRALAAGDVDGDGQEELAVSADGDVSVFSGAELATLAINDGSCDLERPQREYELASASCAESDDVAGCADSRFGQSVQIADFDGDGVGEIAVGAPDLDVSGVPGAGAVEVFDSGGQLVDVRFVSDANEGGRFGEAMVAVPQRGRSILVVGEPGAEAASVVYCTAVAGSDESDRCH